MPGTSSNEKGTGLFEISVMKVTVHCFTPKKQYRWSGTNLKVASSQRIFLFECQDHVWSTTTCMKMYIVLYISNPVHPLGINTFSDSDFSIGALHRGDTLLKLLPFLHLKEHISAACSIKNCYKWSDSRSTDKGNILHRFFSSAITALHLHHV